MLAAVVPVVVSVVVSAAPVVPDVVPVVVPVVVVGAIGVDVPDVVVIVGVRRAQPPFGSVRI